MAQITKGITLDATKKNIFRANVKFNDGDEVKPSEDVWRGGQQWNI